ncbi:MAG: PAS domain S-box protein [Candidatus Cloacimonetes bacterium]|nr:PAS domain S-box protein [Candidatus Cloacimonadota bacterium]
MTPRRHYRGLEHAVVRNVLLGGLPAVAVALWLLWTSDVSTEVRWTLSLVLPSFWIGAAISAYSRTVRPLQLLQNLLGALREGDYSLRGVGAHAGDLLGDVMAEVNELGETLHRQRLAAVEATALLSNVLAEIDVAIFAFDADDELRLVNRAGASLVGSTPEDLIGRTAEDIGLAEYLEGPPARTLDQAFPGATGRWEMRRSEFRQDGRPHRLIVLGDVTRALREEEKLAWQRIVRVLSHEINNSLAPIQSIARSVRRILEKELVQSDRVADVEEGLDVIANRSEALAKLMSEYARLARMPAPKPKPMQVASLVEGVAELETRLEVAVRPPQYGSDVVIQADRAQLEQALINLLRNAADASLETGGGVSITWRSDARYVIITIEDEGKGLDATANLFVPFFTTKPTGSGIGLALSRQIVEAHGGSLQLENRRDRRGARATIRLPREGSTVQATYSD